MAGSADTASAQGVHLGVGRLHVDVGHPHHGHGYAGRGHGYGGRANYGWSGRTTFNHGSWHSGYRGGYGHAHYQSVFRPTWGPHYDWHDTSHYDYHPGEYVPHRNHYHYVPGHYDLHREGHWDAHH
jgi:hypothetical protein